MNYAALLRAGAKALVLLMVCDVARAEERESSVSLHEMLAYADQHAPRIVVGRAQREFGQAEVDGASVVLPDNLVVGAAAGPRFFAESRGVDAQAWLRQRIEIAGERKQRRKTAERSLDRAGKELQEVRWIVHQEVHAAFHRALVAREARDVARKLLLSTEELFSVAEARLRAGDISLLAVRLAHGELAQARQVALAAERAYRTAQLDLAALSGWPPEDPPAPAGLLGAPRKAPQIDRLLQIAFAQHPGIAARASAVEEAKARKRLEDRQAWPKPSIGASYAREAAPVLESEQHIVLGTFAIPFPTSQRNQAQRARAQAELALKEAERDAFSSVLRARLTRAAAAVDADADRIAAYGTEILPAFEQNLALLRRAFELGEVDLLQVVVARERLLKIQGDALAAYQDYYRDIAALEAAVGVEIWPDEHHEQAEEDNQ